MHISKLNIEYKFDLTRFSHSQHYLYELVINTLVYHSCFYQLHQFLQYHVLSDSKPLACLMLSLESVYPPAHQLALDMLKVGKHRGLLIDPNSEKNLGIQSELPDCFVPFLHTHFQSDLKGSASMF